ncbi:MAG: hypothetical protein KJZ54_09485 [Phycisphaerales bacterium]|nr:hypothetical protein [Phycisphaerales bacterium]
MPEQPTTLQDQPASTDDLQRQVDTLLSRLEVESPTEQGGVTPTAHESNDASSDARIEALDHQLAALTEELLEQDEVAEMEPARLESAPARRVEAAPRAASSETQPPTPPPETSAASVPPSPSAPGVPATETSGSVAGSEDHGAATTPSRSTLSESACAVLAGAVEPVAKRLSGMPRGVRDSIGWIGAMTLFYAACVWAVVLVLRGSGVEPPDGPPPEIAPAAQVAEDEGAN